MQDLLATKQRKCSLQLLSVKVYSITIILLLVTLVSYNKFMQCGVIWFEIQHLFKICAETAGRAEWMDKGHKKCLILWLRIQDWANFLINFVRFLFLFAIFS